MSSLWPARRPRVAAAEPLARPLKDFSSLVLDSQGFLGVYLSHVDHSRSSMRETRGRVYPCLPRLSVVAGGLKTCSALEASRACYENPVRCLGRARAPRSPQTVVRLPERGMPQMISWPSKIDEIRSSLACAEAERSGAPSAGPAISISLAPPSVRRLWFQIGYARSRDLGSRFFPSSQSRSSSSFPPPSP